MDRVFESGAAGSPPSAPASPSSGYPTAGNPSLAIAATKPGPWWYHMMTEELRAVIVAAGLTPDHADVTQLTRAIQALFVANQKAVVINSATFEASVADGELVRWDSGNSRFDEAVADGTTNNRAVGVADVTNSKVYLYGECALFSGLTPGARYYLDATTAGALTTTPPTDAVAVGIAKNATTLWVDVDVALGGVAASDLQGQTKTAFTTAGAAPSFTLTPSPAIAAYSANQRFSVKFHAAGAGADTLNISGLGAKSLKAYDSTGTKVAFVPVANLRTDVEYDGVDLVVLDPPPPAVGTANVRQTVLNGSVDASGYGNCLSAGSGLAVNLSATAVPVVISFAAGFDAGGAVDRVGRIIADVAGAWSALTTNSTLFLYVDRNTGTGALAYGFSALVPTYQSTAPAAPAADQHWFDLSTYTMKRWTGAAWAVVQRVFIGEVVTGASTVSSVVTYAYQRRYDSGWTNTLPAAATLISRNHNIGVDDIEVEILLKCLTADQGYSVGEIVTDVMTYASVYVNPTISRSRNVTQVTTGSGSTFVVQVKGTGTFAGTITNASWAYSLRAKGRW